MRRLELDPALAEEAVLLAVARLGEEERRAFRAARDALYELADPGQREARFRALSADWLARLHLASPVHEALDAHPAIDAAVARTLVLRARMSRDEAADLHAAPEGGAPSLVLRLLPSTLADPARAGALLRREALHMADLVDPAFGFAPGEHPAGTRHVLERYRLLWRASVETRLVLAGVVTAASLDRLRAELARTLGEDEAGDWLLRLATGPRPSHQELLARASRSPQAAGASSSK